jgi:hypothetical protein
MDKKSLIQFLEKRETYNKVLEIIENECQISGTRLDDFPLDYFIAGGAVANTIHYLLHKEEFDKPVINDVDLFFFNHLTTPVMVTRNNTDSFLQQEINRVVNVNNYNNYWLGFRGEEIRMVNSERFDVINKITINVHLLEKNFVSDEYYQQLLDNFDLNCVQVGVDRVNNKIIYTEEFIHFLETNKIEVTSIKQPLQTAVRMYKKGFELKTDKTSFEKEMSLLQHSFLINPMRSIGPEWTIKSDKYKDFLRKYFVETNINRIVEGIINYTSHPFELEPFVSQFTFTNTNELLFFWDIFVRVKNEESLHKLLTFYTNFKNLSENTEVKTWDFENNFITLFKPQRYDIINICGLLPKYLDCDYSVEDLVTIDEFISSLTYSGLDPSLFIVSNIEEQLDFIKFFTENLINKYDITKTSVIHKIVTNTKHSIEDRLNLVSHDKEVKLKTIKKLLNNSWITFNIKQHKPTNVIDVSW